FHCLCVSSIKGGGVGDDESGDEFQRMMDVAWEKKLLQSGQTQQTSSSFAAAAAKKKASSGANTKAGKVGSSALASNVAKSLSQRTVGRKRGVAAGASLISGAGVESDDFKETSSPSSNSDH